MIFNSFVFVVFFVIVYALYRMVGTRWRWQNRLLLVASYVFYAYWDWRFLSLIIASTVVDYFCGIKIAEAPARKKTYLTASVVTNLGILFAFKYLGFFADSFVAVLDTMGFAATPVTMNIVLPVGISFYTFQTMSYTIDIYRGKLEPCRNFLDFALFVSFFPQLVAGPIERAVNLMPQLTRPRTLAAYQMREGMWLVAWGYFKKVYVADNLAGMVDTVFAAPTATGAESLIAVYAFAIQIYGDFSGYSDIARGLAKLLGIDLMVNFNLPYFAVNPPDFWRRWHISLSTWLRDYLYISLGGSRGTTLFTYRNLFLTMLLGGLWHGAAWTFVAWGVYQGVILIGHRLMPTPHWGDGRAGQAVRKALAMVVMFQFTCVGWLLFRAESLVQAKSMFVAVFTNWDFTLEAETMFVRLVGLCVVLIIVQLFQFFKDDSLFVLKLPRPVVGMVYGVLAYFVLIHGAVSDAFIYFQF